MRQADRSTHCRVLHQMVSVVSPHKAMQESGFRKKKLQGKPQPVQGKSDLSWSRLMISQLCVVD
jgi:hypothetical protein